MNVCDYVQLVVCTLIAIGYVSYFIYKLCKTKSIKKAMQATKEVAEDLYNTVNSEKFLKLKEQCKNFIYSAEKLFSKYAGKAGVFKLDSVLKDMQVACMQENVQFDREFWTNFIGEEVASMKEVK